MGYKHVGVAFVGDWEVEADAIGAWLDATTLSRCIFAPLVEDGVLAGVDQQSIDAQDGAPLAALSDLDHAVTPGENQTLAVFAGDQDDADVLLHVGLTRLGARLVVGLSPSRTPADVRDRCAGWVHAWSQRLAERRCYLSTATFGPQRKEYPRPRPPHEHPHWRLGALDLYLGRTWHGWSPARSEVLQRLASAPLPEGASRHAVGDVVQLAFAAELGDRTSVDAARRRGEDWLTPLVPAEVTPGWNELGDRQVVVVGAIDRAPFTFFDPARAIGYKTLIVDPESREIDEDSWAELAAIARASRLPDGSEVTSVRLVFPVRDDAVAMHARARTDGFEMTTYPGTPGVLWQVRPPDDAV